jgi:hypothetical protein
MTGQAEYRALISAVSQASKCQVTTTEAHGYSTGQNVRISDVGNMMPTPRGMVQINGNEYLIEVDSTTTFLLKDPITQEYIDSTGYEAYVSGGRTKLENTTFLWVYP